MLPIEHCRRIAQDWASWIKEPLVYEPPKAEDSFLDDPFVRRYSFLTPSGKDRVEVNALRGDRLTWTNLPATARAAERAAKSTTPAAGTTRKRSEVAAEFMERYLRWVPGAQYLPFGADLWAVCVSRRCVGTVVVRGDDRTGQVRYASQWQPAVRPALAPAVSLHRASKAVRGALTRHLLWFALVELAPNTRFAGLESQGVEALTDMPDCLGMRRLAYGFCAVLEERQIRLMPGPRVGEEDRRMHTVVAGFSVDAQSGEVYPSEDPFVGWLETVQGEKVPHLDLGELSHPDLAFPPKIRAQRPYLYVGYLGSAIWRGQVSGKKDYSAVVKYRGKTWTLKADSREALVDGAPRQFPQSPLMIRGYLYLPACLIEAITGWHMTYVPRENTVYLYTTASRSSPQHDG